MQVLTIYVDELDGVEVKNAGFTKGNRVTVKISDLEIDLPEERAEELRNQLQEVLNGQATVA